MAQRKPTLREYLAHILFRFIRPVTLGVKAVVLDEGGGKVLLVRHTYMPGWHLPGGGVEPGENIRATLEKELREECNIDLTGEPELFGVYHNTFATRRDHIVLFVCLNFRQNAAKKPDMEIAEASFFPVGALPEETSNSTRQRIREVLEGRAPNALWVADGRA